MDVVFIRKGDWKYEGSKAGAAGGGRTHTFGLRKPASKLRNARVYALPMVIIKNGKPVLSSN